MQQRICRHDHALVGAKFSGSLTFDDLAVASCRTAEPDAGAKSGCSANRGRQSRTRAVPSKTDSNQRRLFSSSNYENGLFGCERGEILFAFVIGRLHGDGLPAMQKLHATIHVFDDGGAAIHPVAAVDVGQAVGMFDRGAVNVAADHAIHAAFADGNGLSCVVLDLASGEAEIMEYYQVVESVS